MPQTLCCGCSPLAYAAIGTAFQLIFFALTVLRTV